MIIHIVTQGETLYQIAHTYSSSVQRIISDNGLIYPYLLAIGQALIISRPAEIHLVKTGETPDSIALAYGISLLELYQNNPELTSEAELYPHQSLVIRFQNPQKRTLFTNGYVYPHVNRHLLQRTLPFLSYLSILSYGMKDDGSLIPLDDFELLTYAQIYQALPVFVLTFPNKTGTLLTQKFLENINFQNTILDQIIQMMIEKGYRGFASNFTDIPKNTFDAYKSFLENLRIRLQNHGLFLHATLPLKREGNPSGLHSDQQNYHELSTLCDHTSLMTYEWDYTYVHTSALNLK